jgi:hypothetical protein
MPGDIGSRRFKKTFNLVGSDALPTTHRTSCRSRPIYRHNSSKNKPHKLNLVCRSPDPVSLLRENDQGTKRKPV